MSTDYSTYGYTDTTIRGISPAIRKAYGCRVGIDEGTGDVSELCYPYGGGWKIRKLPKKFFSNGKKKGLFGQGVVKSSTLVIVEGEEDAMACYQMMVSKWQYNPPAVVSLPDGATSLGVLTEEMDFILSHDKVVLCMDNDEAGRAGVRKITSLLTMPVHIAKMPEKDANDCLLKGMQAEFIQAMMDAKLHKPETILSVKDCLEDARKLPEWGRLYPWPSLNKLTYGRRDGDGRYVAAGTKIGKTEELSQMVHHIIEVEKLPVMLFKFEQGAGETVKAVAGKVAHKRFNIPDLGITQEELDEAIDHVDGKIYIFDTYMNGDDDDALLWDRMKPAIRHAVVNLGVKDIFIDPITQITDGLLASETDVELRRFSNQLAGMAHELGFFYHCYAHLKAPTHGPSHEEGGRVKTSQMRGSRAMAEKCKLAIGITRDLYADDPVEKNTSTFHVLLNSGVGKTGSFPVYYDDVTGDYLEPRTEF